MKRVTAAIAIALSTASFTPAEAQFGTNLQFRTPLNYRFSVLPKSHVFQYNRHRHHAWRYRGGRIAGLPVLRGPAVIYESGEIGVPPPAAVIPTPAPGVQPVVYRIGERGGCGREQLQVPGSNGRTTINVWRC